MEAEGGGAGKEAWRQGGRKEGAAEDRVKRKGFHIQSTQRENIENVSFYSSWWIPFFHKTSLRMNSMPTNGDRAEKQEMEVFIKSNTRQKPNKQMEANNPRIVLKLQRRRTHSIHYWTFLHMISIVTVVGAQLPLQTLSRDTIMADVVDISAKPN